MVQVLDLPAGNLEQLVSHVSSMFSQSLRNTDCHLGHAGRIYNLDGYIGWLHMYYGALGMSLSQQTALLQNSPPNQEFQLFQNFVMPGVCLVPDPLTGLSMKGFVQGLHLASLCPERLTVGQMLQE